MVTGNYVSNLKPGDFSTGIYLGAGMVSGNTVIDCYFGIDAGGNTINHNVILGCFTGIRASSGSIIGNSVQAYTMVTSTGIDLSLSDLPNLLTQNTVVNYKTPFMPGSHSINVANSNAGF
jgi:hypothetical protein